MKANLPPIETTVLQADGVAVELEDSWFQRLTDLTVQAAWQDDGGPAPRRLTPRPTASRPPRLEMTLLLAGDDTLQRLNREFRGLDRPTDVLSFAQLEGTRPVAAPGRTLYLGDVAVSVERARRQAADYGHRPDREMAYLFVHGLLHLLGYDHEVESERVAMRRVEEAALGAAGLVREIPAAR